MFISKAEAIFELNKREGVTGRGFVMIRGLRLGIFLLLILLIFLM